MTIEQQATPDMLPLPDTLPDVSIMSSSDRINYIQACRQRLQYNVYLSDEHLTNATRALTLERSVSRGKASNSVKEPAVVPLALDDL